MRIPKAYEKARVEYLDVLASSICETCDRIIECRYCYKEPNRRERYMLCNRNGFHYHERCLKREKGRHKRIG